MSVSVSAEFVFLLVHTYTDFLHYFQTKHCLMRPEYRGTLVHRRFVKMCVQCAIAGNPPEMGFLATSDFR